MSAGEIIFAVICMAASAAGSFYVRHIVKVSGRDRPHDPELVRKFVENAPMHRLKHVLK